MVTFGQALTLRIGRIHITFMWEKLKPELAKILEVSETDLEMEFNLEDGNWDSVAILSCIGVFDAYFQKTVEPKQLWKCKTVSDVVQLLPVA